jgi:glutamine---fructose-6-phosphate transaminase (isomerizing)
MPEDATYQTSARREFPHAMLREIYDQPRAIRETIEKNVQADAIFPGALEPLESALHAFRKIIVAASGSSRNAGLAGEIMMEDIAGVAVDVEYASEYCYRSTHAGSDPIVIVISQSGETGDTIAALREALHRGAQTIGISNVPESTLTRETTASLLTFAGPEKAVPATKSFTTQRAILHLFSLFLARRRGRVTSEVTRVHLARLLALPDSIERNLDAWDKTAAEAARFCRDARSFLLLGRGIHYAIAREGALKLKELSYVQAEGMPAGELRHGPNALVASNLTVVAIATRDATDPDSVLRYKKTLDVLSYVKSHGARAIAVATEDDQEVAGIVDRVLSVPGAPELLLPIVEVVPLQLFAYHFAVLAGSNVDSPRNLVKAVVKE